MLRPICTHNGGCFETLNLLHQVVVKCLRFVMSYMKQNKKFTQTLKSVQYRLDIIFNRALSNQPGAPPLCLAKSILIIYITGKPMD